jgi:copper homeostasis protein
MSENIRIEVCIDNYESIKNTLKSNVDRLEVCSALNVDGLTPTVGLVKFAQRISRSETHVMLRPHTGGFIYSKDDQEIMLEDLNVFVESDIDGIVLGALTEDGEIDEGFLMPFLDIVKKKNIQITFHRAIDLTQDYFSSIETLIELGFTRVLTSGCSSNVLTGLKTIKLIQDKYGSDIEIMPGGGITANNIKAILDTGVKNIHCSASVNKTFATSSSLLGNKLLQSKVTSESMLMEISTQLS